MQLKCHHGPVIAALISCASVATGTAETRDRVTRVLPFEPGVPIRVDASIADVTITGSNRPDVLVDVVRRAPGTADLAKYPVEIEQRPDLIHISARQVADGRDASLRTEIAITAPPAANFQAIRVFEGRVRLTNLHNACDVDLRRGPVEASALAGRIRLESGIGSIDIKDSELTPGGMMRLRVFNGPLRVRFPRLPANARLLAVTLRGTITSDIPLTRKEQFGPRFGETTLGSGDPVMSMDVVYGDISIRVDR